MKKHLSSLTILVEDRQANVAKLNKLLTDHGHTILSRLGVNINKTCLEHCMGLIILVVEGTSDQIHELTKKISKLKGMKVKNSIITE